MAKRDIGASLRSRLLKLARERGQPFDLVITRYALGRYAGSEMAGVAVIVAETARDRNWVGGACSCGHDYWRQVGAGRV